MSATRSMLEAATFNAALESVLVLEEDVEAVRAEVRALIDAEIDRLLALLAGPVQRQRAEQERQITDARRAAGGADFLVLDAAGRSLGAYPLPEQATRACNADPLARRVYSIALKSDISVKPPPGGVRREERSW